MSRGASGPTAWPPGPTGLRLDRDEVHVWRGDLAVAPDRLAALAATLAPDEHDRAARFHFERDRRRFVAGRGILRAVLARHAGCPATALRFRYGPRGKPALEGDGGGGDLRFNVSHSGDLALVAVARGREIGVDVEALRPDLTPGLAERFFSPAEVAALSALPPAARPAAFFACWTRKEAFVKATGDGLSLPLDAFDVSLAPGEPPALLRVADDPHGPDRWRLVALEPAPGFAAALAVEGRDWRLACWAWAP